MDSGIHDDQNFYARGPLAQSPECHQPPFAFPGHLTPEGQDASAFRSISPVPPSLSLTSANLQTVTSNEFDSDSGLSAGIDPDDFYREYKGPPPPLSNGHSDLASDDMDMATKTSNLRHPTVAVARTSLKSTYRSVSAPMNDKIPRGSSKPSTALNGISPYEKPSVKDLLKRFDQNKEPAPSVITRKPAPRLIARDPPNTGVGYARKRAGSQARSTTNPQTNSPPRTALTRSETANPAATSRPSPQRSRTASQEQVPKQPLSITTHTSQLKNTALSNNTHASRSMTNLSPTTSNRSALSPTRKPLFGEILPSQGQLQTGQGISQTPRRTSDPTLCTSPTSLEGRSAVDVSPSSPTAWYLNITPKLENVNHNKHHDASPSHSRYRSSSAGSSLNTGAGGIPSNGSTASTITQTHGVGKSASRLPISTKRLSGQSGSSTSPTSPVSNIANPNKTHVIARRRIDQNSSNAASTTRITSSKPTISSPQQSSSQQTPRRVRVPENLNMNSSGLKAYISAPPPKTSPPLRSSRPRPPVSSATTTNPRQGATDASGSPQRTQYSANGTYASETSVRTPQGKVQTTPVDFAARRERIQRAYTRSIHESEQRQVRADNLRRLHERLAKKQAAEKQAEGAVGGTEEETERGARREASREGTTDDAENAAAEAEQESHGGDVSPSEILIADAIPAHLSDPRKPLQITTSFLLPDGNEDSPTLGMPGGFLDDDEPASAVTDATATTEFDNEPQTEAPQLSCSSIPTVQSGNMASSSIFQWGDLSVEQATYGIRHSLSMSPYAAGPSSYDTYDTPIGDYQPEHTPTNDWFVQDPSLPGTFKHDSGEYNPLSFAGRLTSPKRTPPPPPQSRTTTPLKSVNRISRIEHADAQQSGTSQIYPPRILLHPEHESTDSAKITSVNLPHVGLDEALDYLRTPPTESNYDSSSSNSGGKGSRPDSFDGSYEHSQGIKGPPGIDVLSKRSSWTDDYIRTTESSGHDEYIISMPVTLPEPPNLKAPPEGSVESPSGKSSDTHADPDADADLPIDGAFGLTFSNLTSVPSWPSHTPPPPPGPPHLDHEPSPVPLWPSHTPPPPGPPQLEHEPPNASVRSSSLIASHMRPATGFYPEGQGEAARSAESPRASEDIGSVRASLYMRRSSTQISLEGSTANQSFESRDVLIEATEEERKAAEKLKKRLFQRRMLIKELIDTESVYLKDMNVVEEIYKGTAEACPNLNANDIRTIFRNTDEIVAFSTMFLDELKTAGASVYSQRSQKKTTSPSPEDRLSVAATLTDETDDQRDRRTFIGANFGKHLKRMQTIYTDFLKNSELSSAKLTTLQADGAVKVWLSECNLVAKDLTAAWDIDALLVKPVQRITRYQLLLAQIFEHTAENHPDWQALRITVDELASLLKNIDDLKKRIQMVGKIVGRKRKESDVRTGIAKAFGRRTEKAQATNISRLHDDEVYRKLHERFGDDYLRLQVVLRDVEFYTRETTTYVRKFLEHLSSIELLMRIGSSPYPELESKWVRFNISMRNMGDMVLENHLSSVRIKVIEPFEQAIQAYGPPGLAMKKRNKRRLDYEKYMTLKGQGKKVDDKLQDLVDQYEALNETLKHELPKLATLTESIGNVCLVQLIGIQTQWYGIWQDKVRTVLEESQLPNDVADIVSMFNRDYTFVEARAQELGIVNGTFLTTTPKPRTSQSTQSTAEPKGRPSNLSSRSRAFSFNSDRSPSLPTPDFERDRHSGQFTFSSLTASSPGITPFGHQTSTQSNGHSRNGSLTPVTPDPMSSFENRSHTTNPARPNTSRSATSDAETTRPNEEYNKEYGYKYRRESRSMSHSAYRNVETSLPSSRPFSGIFHSAMPLPDGPEELQRSSRASSRDHNDSGGYNILYLAASLFEFTISATKSEAGYPYLTYQAGEIFDVIGEKGELWLAKNQDDMSNRVGWIWSKHFARLAAD